jgi:DNA-binding MarR family transcriptional regulator
VSHGCQPSHLPDYQRLHELTREIPELDPDDVMTVVLLRSVADAMQWLLQKDLETYSISEGRFRVLTYLLDRGQPTSHSDIANASGVTKGTVTGLVDGLERDGLVRRCPCPVDRRVTYIELTDEGNLALKRILPGHLKRLSALVGGITEAEQLTLNQLLEKVRTRLLREFTDLYPDAGRSDETGDQACQA